MRKNYYKKALEKPYVNVSLLEVLRLIYIHTLTNVMSSNYVGKY